MAKPQNCIPVQTAKNMYTNWQSSRGAALESDGYQNVSDFTFSLAEMQEFIDYVAKASEKDGITNPGIRVYFAANGPDAKTTASVFLAPTLGTDSDSANNYALEPLNRGTNGWPPNVY
ncbi:MAG: hypothetical protein KJN76_00635 [Eudoraea sp.]|nr:hypothetical protein [Eudoraea sp.]